MFHALRELLRAAEESGVACRVVSRSESDQIWALIGRKYFPGEAPLIEGQINWLWHYLANHTSVQTPRDWQLVAEFIGHRSAYLLFNPADELAIVEFFSGSDVMTTLGESYRFEYYLTDAIASYLLGRNHHDFLIGAGAAAGWVAEVAQR